MENGVEFVAADMQFANKLTIHILAAVAEHEREAIRARTKAALAAAKGRGVMLGGPKLKQAQRRGIAANKAKADRFAANVLPVMEQIKASGVSHCVPFLEHSTPAALRPLAAASGRQCK
jgi:DNA invertase Pin-like site-specific DNA recombinase